MHDRLHGEAIQNQSLRLLSVSALFAAGETDENGPDDEDGAPLPLDQIEFWGYQIQGIDDDGAIDALAASRHDMLVLEPTRTDAELLDLIPRPWWTGSRPPRHTTAFTAS